MVRSGMILAAVACLSSCHWVLSYGPVGQDRSIELDRSDGQAELSRDAVHDLPIAASDGGTADRPDRGPKDDVKAKLDAKQDSGPDSGPDAAQAVVTVGTLAGGNGVGFLNGPVATAKFGQLVDVVVDKAGVVYVADEGNSCVRTISGGTVTTFAGTCTSSGFANGLVSAAKFTTPGFLALDGTGKLYVGEYSVNRIRLVSAGSVTTFAGGTGAGSANGSVATAQFNNPHGMVVDATGGKVYVADRGNHRIRVITGGMVSTLVGSSQGYTDGALGSAKLDNPHNLATDAAGKIWVTEAQGHRVRMIAGGIVSTVAGTGASGFKDGPVASALLNLPGGIALHTSGALFIADYYNYAVRKIAGGMVSTVAGTGSSGCIDGLAATAKLGQPEGIAVWQSNTIYVADQSCQAIRKLTW
jgi:DNA-binding beta-propeller fold protein YncE